MPGPPSSRLAASLELAILAGAACVMLGGAACGGTENNDVRGRNLTEASLSAADQAHVYEAAARVGFDVGDPSLSLLIDPRELPRTVGLVPTDSLSAAVLSALDHGGVFKGRCEPPLHGPPGAPRCKAALPGYVLRFSPVFEIRGDSTQVYVYAQLYDNAQSGRSSAQRFERAYQVVRRGDGWKAVREGNVSKDVRGERR